MRDRKGKGEQEPYDPYPLREKSVDMQKSTFGHKDYGYKLELIWKYMLGKN